MIDFIKIHVEPPKKKDAPVLIYPKFLVRKSSDLMIRGRDFYAVWIEEKGLWSTDEQDALDLIDREVQQYYNANKHKWTEAHVLYLWDSTSGMIDRWHKYCQQQMRDNFHMLDEKLIFSNTDPKKEDYASKRLYILQKNERKLSGLSELWFPATAKKFRNLWSYMDQQELVNPLCLTSSRSCLRDIIQYLMLRRWDHQIIRLHWSHSRQTLS